MESLHRLGNSMLSHSLASSKASPAYSSITMTEMPPGLIGLYIPTKLPNKIVSFPKKCFNSKSLLQLVCDLATRLAAASEQAKAEGRNKAMSSR